MDKKFTYYFIPAFLVAYFFIALIPVVNNKMSEFFPFFSFKLYSKVPEACDTYDILFDQGLPTASFLLYENTKLSRFERRTYGNRIGQLVKNHDGDESATWVNDSKLLANAQTAQLVKISGDCIDRVKDDRYELQVIKNLK